MPNEPVISIQELARSWAVGSSQRRKPVSGAIRQALTPTPQSTRAASRPEKLVASENATQPATAISQEAEDHLLGSVAVQPGSQAEAGLPRSRGNSRPPASPARCALSANSRVRVGDSVAVIARSSAEKK